MLRRLLALSMSKCMELILMRAYVYVNINMVENNVDINDVDDNNDNHKELNKGE